MTWLVLRAIDLNDGWLHFRAGDVIEDGELYPFEIEQLIERGLIARRPARFAGPKKTTR